MARQKPIKKPSSAAKATKPEVPRAPETKDELIEGELDKVTGGITEIVVTKHIDP
jgi:hypothetical protein